MACRPVALWCGIEGGTFMPRRSVRELSTGPPTQGHGFVRSHFGTRACVAQGFKRTVVCSTHARYFLAMAVDLRSICSYLERCLARGHREHRLQVPPLCAIGQKALATGCPQYGETLMRCMIMMTNGVCHHERHSDGDDNTPTWQRSRGRTIGHGEESTRRTPSLRRSSTSRRRSTGSWRAEWKQLSD